MSSKQIIHLTEQPNIVLLFVKAVLMAILKTVANIKTIKHYNEEFSVSGLQVDNRNLKHYVMCCGFSDIDYLPITYPFVMAFPLLMRLMTSSQFPISILGLIHYRNTITQYQQIKSTAKLTVNCQVEQDCLTSKGRQIEIHITVFVDSELIWECTSTFLQKSKQKRIKPTSSLNNTSSINAEEVNTLTQKTVTTLKFSHWDAVKYAYISKDINPIHLQFIPAKLAGFQSTIVHGMLAKARMLAELEPLIKHHRISIDVKFKKPIFVPTRVSLNVAVSQQNNSFTLTSLNQRVTHLHGVISPFLNKTN